MITQAFRTSMAAVRGSRARWTACAVALLWALPLGAATEADLELEKKRTELERDIEAARVAQGHARADADLATYKALRELTGSLGGREGSIDADATKVPKLLRYQALAVGQQIEAIEQLCKDGANWNKDKAPLIRTASPLDLEAMAAALTVEPEVRRHQTYIAEALAELDLASAQTSSAAVVGPVAALGVVVDIAKLFRTDRNVASWSVETDLATRWFDLKCNVTVLDPLWEFVGSGRASSDKGTSLDSALKDLKASITRAGKGANAFRKNKNVADDAAGPPALALLESRLAAARAVDTAVTEARVLAGIQRSLWLQQEMQSKGRHWVSFRMLSETTQFVDKPFFGNARLSGFGTAVAEVLVRDPKTGKVVSAAYVTRSGAKLDLEYGKPYLLYVCASNPAGVKDPAEGQGCDVSAP